MTKIKKLNKKSIIIAVVALLIVAGAASVYLKKRSNDSRQQPVATNPQDTINYDPPTEQDAQRVDENKQKIVEREAALGTQPVNNGDGKQPVKPIITYAGQYENVVEVGGYINGIFEDGGQCTATFTNGNASFTKTVMAVKNARSVDCPSLSANTTEFSPKGIWNVSLSYNSPAYSGASDNRQVEVK